MLLSEGERRRNNKKFDFYYTLFLYICFLSGFRCCVKKEMEKINLEKNFSKKIILAICVLKNNRNTQHGVAPNIL
jgi:hypothetical protein